MSAMLSYCAPNSLCVLVQREKSIEELMEAVDKNIPQPVREVTSRSRCRLKISFRFRDADGGDGRVERAR